MPTRTKILVVEDNSDMLYCVTHELSKFGYAVQGATSSLEACEILDRKKFDVIISDIHMPNGNGFQFASLLKEANVNLVRLAISGGVYSDKVIKEAGFSAFIQKPF